MKQPTIKHGSQTELHTLSSEQLKMVEEMAGVCFTPEEICIAIEGDWDVLKRQFKNKQSVFYKAYKKGSLLHMFNVRKSIYELAKGGSSASQSEFLKLRKESDTYIQKNNL